MSDELHNLEEFLPARKESLPAQVDDVVDVISVDDRDADADDDDDAL